MGSPVESSFVTISGQQEIVYKDTLNLTFDSKNPGEHPSEERIRALHQAFVDCLRPSLDPETPIPEPRFKPGGGWFLSYPLKGSANFDELKQRVKEILTQNGINSA